MGLFGASLDRYRICPDGRYIDFAILLNIRIGFVEADLCIFPFLKLNDLFNDSNLEIKFYLNPKKLFFRRGRSYI